MILIAAGIILIILGIAEPRIRGSVFFGALCLISAYGLGKKKKIPTPYERSLEVAGAIIFLAFGVFLLFLQLYAGWHSIYMVIFIVIPLILGGLWLYSALVQKRSLQARP
jgi:hypothetical protein